MGTGTSIAKAVHSRIGIVCRSALTGMVLLAGSAALAQDQGPAVPDAPAAVAAPAPGTTAVTPPSETAPTMPVAAQPAAPTRPDTGATGTAPAAASATPAPDSLAPTVTPEAAQSAPPAASAQLLPHDLSPWGMFMAADMIVKAVMLGLAFASIVTWTIALGKSVEIIGAKTRLRRGISAILAAPDLETADHALCGRRGPATQMVRAARHEAGASAAAIGPGLLARVSSHLGRIEAQAGRRLTLGTGVLATIGATAPFVGLFGTVWGIMNSFIGISETQTTNLAVVAPGIAEALLATALGLVAAIPAVVIYNHFARSISAYRSQLADAAAAVERLVSRDLDHARLPTPALARAAE